MDNTSNKSIRNVADVAARIMMGEKALHPNQQKLDVHEPEKDELTADDFKKLRSGKKADVKKEEVESVEEADTLLARTGMNLPHKFPRSGQTNLGNIPAMNTPGNSKETDAYAKKRREDRAKQLKPAIKAALGTHGPKGKLPEEVEQMDEVKMADLPSTKVQGRSYGSSKPEPHAVDTLSGPKEKELKDIDAEKKKKKFSEMVSLYQDKGLKSLSEMLAKEETEVAVSTLDVDDINGVQISIVQEEVEQVEERQMSDDEMNKREDIVKSMKKGMAGFKERYGKDAKSVMYATATKQSMKD
jgi:hypothetical protein